MCAIIKPRAWRKWYNDLRIPVFDTEAGILGVVNIC
jgi:hypothetical protein